MSLYMHLPFTSWLRLQLVLEPHGVVLPRRAGRWHGPSRQEPEEVVGRPPLQRLALEGLHAASRCLAARDQHQEEHEREPQKLQKNNPPASSSLQTARHICRAL